MEIPDHICNGVVILDCDAGLPDGTAVTVSPRRRANERAPDEAKRVIFPLVHGKIPASIDLTNERIGEILDGGDALA